MKITFVIYSLSATGGAERAVTSLSNYFSKDFDVSIITLKKSTPFYHLDTKVKLKYCLDDISENTNILSSLYNAITRLWSLIKNIKSENPNVIISFMTTSNILCIIACKILGKPIIISERANHAIVNIGKVKEFIRDFLYKYANKLIVQTAGNKAYYLKTLKKEKIEIIPNAIGHQLQKQRNLNVEKQNIILNVGSFKNGKAQDLLIRAFSEIDNKNWKLIFLGKGPNLEIYKNLAENLKVKNIEFLGSTENVSYFYNQAGAFVFTSEHEGFPNALLEALYFGIPCIATDCPHGPSDLIQNNQNGFLVPVGEINILIQKINLLIDSEELRKKFKKNALQTTQKYEIDQVGKKWLKAIQSI